MFNKRAFLSLVFVFLLFGQFSYAETAEVLLDVRTPSEFSEAHIPDSTNIDFRSDNFKAELEKLDRSKSYQVYCRSGKRSGQAVSIMKSMGFKDVKDVGGVSDAAKLFKKTCKGTNPKIC